MAGARRDGRSPALPALSKRSLWWGAPLRSQPGAAPPPLRPWAPHGHGWTPAGLSIRPHGKRGKALLREGFLTPFPSRVPEPLAGLGCMGGTSRLRFHKRAGDLPKSPARLSRDLSPRQGSRLCPRPVGLAASLSLQRRGCPRSRAWALGRVKAAGYALRLAGCSFLSAKTTQEENQDTWLVCQEERKGEVCLHWKKQLLVAQKPSHDRGQQGSSSPRLPREGEITSPWLWTRCRSSLERCGLPRFVYDFCDVPTLRPRAWQPWGGQGAQERGGNAAGQCRHGVRKCSRWAKVSYCSREYK